ncbi:MAG: gluconate 2-dehydrogenase subunit 3 family protein [Pseudomonadota bacterium]|nr:gluconate 2-dehydrogenase subunit 3 family protein [Pseudomonadota bacterium]
MANLRRRDILAGTALFFIGEAASRAGIVRGSMPWAPDAASPPTPYKPGPYTYFTPAEAEAVEALADRIIPPDPQTPGGKDAGCAVFIDRQLTGSYGNSQDLYTEGPFQHGAPNQGPQSADTPADVYRKGLAAIDRHCRAEGGQPFARLPPDRQDEVIRGLESGSLHLDDIDGKVLFSTLLNDVQEGFFADPLYGGNRDICAWKMIGFPGARYDYREWVSRHNERVP